MHFWSIGFCLWGSLLVLDDIKSASGGILVANCLCKKCCKNVNIAGVRAAGGAVACGAGIDYIYKMVSVERGVKYGIPSGHRAGKSVGRARGGVMRSDAAAKFVIASCVVGLGMVAFRSIRLVGVCLALAGGRIRRRQSPAGDGRAAGSPRHQ